MLLIEHLGFEHPRQHDVDRSRWPKEWGETVKDARFVAERAGFRVASITVGPEVPLRTWRAVATRILVDYEGMGLICIHSKGGTRWLWSSASLEHRRTAAILAEGIRHISVELEPDGDAPAGFLTLLSEMEVTAAGSALEVLTKVSEAFDQYTAELHADIGENTFEALRRLSEGLLSRSGNRLKRDVATLERIRPEVFILLYRLLFVLYAEAREIFPVGHPVYREKYSLQWWRENVTLPLETEGDTALKPFGGERGTALWQRCRGLFHLIKSGSNALGHKPEEFSFRPYYGTIFDDEIHPDLEAWEVPNGPLAEALRVLTRFREEGGSTFFVDYSSLEIRHLGSIYEHLLEYHLTIGKEGRVEHTIDPQERKSTGSYFTPSALIERLVADAMDPLLGRIRGEVGDLSPEAFERAVYALNVCDPAMGSGHFLVGVLTHLTEAILDYRQRAGVSAGSTEEVVEVKRTIVRQSLYGVDKNPLAVELAKMSLWLETANSSRPLSFLDAHFKTGDSLVGAWFKSLMDPQRSILGEDIQDHLRSEVRDLVAIERQEEIDAVDVMNKVHQYRRIRSPATRYGRLARLLDAQVSSYFRAPMEDWRSARGLLRRPGEFDAFVDRPPWREGYATARRIGFFHWELEFPEQFFTEEGAPRPDPGFDAVVGNPPWDNLQVADREFFRYRAPEIANAQTAAIRVKMIEQLKEKQHVIWEEYQTLVRDCGQLGEFIRASGDYPLSRKGDMNYYAFFIEKSLLLVRRAGALGMVVPTGLVTDFGNREVVKHLMESGWLRRVEDFQNAGAFPDVDVRFKFCLLTIVKEASGAKCRFVFWVAGLEGLSEIDQPTRWFELSNQEIAIFNPNTHALPLFRGSRDLEINRKIYSAAGGVLLDTSVTPARNPWRIKPRQMINMSTDSKHFRTRTTLEKDGWKLKVNLFVKEGKVMVPLLEAKMIHLWNPRFATYHDADDHDIRKGHCRDASTKELEDPGWEPLPRYWIAREFVNREWERLGWSADWIAGFRRVTNSTNSRTMIATFASRVAFGDKLPILMSELPAEQVALLVANLNSIPFDYAVRNKAGGTQLDFFILYQLPVLPPESYGGWRLDGRPLAEFVGDAAVSLACASRALQGLREEAGFKATAVRWDEAERFRVMRILDGVYAHLYGLTREEFSYLLDTFPITRENDLQRYGEFRTKTEALRAYDDLEGRLTSVKGKA